MISGSTEGISWRLSQQNLLWIWIWSMREVVLWRTAQSWAKATGKVMLLTEMEKTKVWVDLGGKMRTLIWDMFAFEVPNRYPKWGCRGHPVVWVWSWEERPRLSVTFKFIKESQDYGSPRNRTGREKGQGPQMELQGMLTIKGLRDERESAEETKEWLV